MVAQRKSVPDFVEWSQSAILTLLNKILSVLSSKRVVTVVKPNDLEILGRLDEVVLQLERLNTQLAVATGNTIDLGEGV